MENLLAQKIYLNDFQQNATKAHFEILMKWKEVHNLTSLDTFEDIYWNHYVDCFRGFQALDKMYPEELSQLPPTLYDLGSGAGFPGLLAAVWWPNKNIVLIESSKKKCSFLRIACQRMKLNRVNVVCQRVETLRDIEFAITRAAFSDDNWEQIKMCLASNARVAFWLSGKQVKIKPGWALEKVEYYELEPGHQREVAVFHVEH